MKPILRALAILVCLILAACAGAISSGGGGQQTPSPWEPQPGDENLAKGEAFVDQAEILILESFPPQFRLKLSGTLPTPCHQLRVVVSQPDAEERLNVEVYSVVDPNQVCIQVVEPFEANVPIGSYTSGEYIVLVNGEQVGEVKP
mgnify:CR=1 FL=1